MTSTGLTRQNLPVLDRTPVEYAAAAGVARGGYVLSDGVGKDPDVLLVATGSEVQIASTRSSCWPATLSRHGWCPCPAGSGSPNRRWTTRTRCCPRASAPGSASKPLSGNGGARSSATPGWIISLEHFGASADYQRLYTEFGITADAVAQAARDSLTQAGAGLDAIRPGGVQDTSAPDTGRTGDQPG